MTLPPAALASTSPKSVNVSAATVIASAGPSATIGVTKRRVSPSLSMRPQSYCGGCTPSPRKLSPASASSASPAAIVDRDQKRLRDVREYVPPQQPEAPDAEHARGRQVVGACHRRCERLAEPREVRCDRNCDADHRSLRTDADHRRDEDRNEQRGERDGQVDEPGHEPTDTASDERQAPPRAGYRSMPRDRPPEWRA